MYVQNWVFKHAEDVSQQQNQEYAGLLIRRREEELWREARRQNDERAKFEAQFSCFWAELESHESRTSQGQQSIRELHSEIMQWQASSVQPDPSQDFVIQDMRSGMTRQEAKIESQKAEMKSLQRDVEATQDSLNHWDEVNLNLIQGVYVEQETETRTDLQWSSEQR